MVINVSKKSHVKWNDEMINEALSLGGDKICDIFPPNVASNSTSGMIDFYTNMLVKEIDNILTPDRDVVNVDIHDNGLNVDIHDNGLNFKLVRLLKSRYPELAIIYPCYKYTVGGAVFEKFRFY